MSLQIVHVSVDVSPCIVCMSVQMINFEVPQVEICPTCFVTLVVITKTLPFRVNPGG